MKTTTKLPKPFAVFDLDGTLIRWQLYHAIADTMVKLGYADEDTYRKAKDARMAWKRREDSEAFKVYELELVKAYEAVLTKLSYEQFHRAAQMVFNEYKDQVYTYTRDLIKNLKTQGYLLFAISGSQIEIVQMIAAYYGFDDCVGSIYEKDENGFTGKVTVHREGKHIILDQLVKKHDATYAASYAVGDSEGDITMLQAVENPIAMNPTAKLFTTAKQCNWKVVVERKNVIYELEPSNGSYLLA
jgi:HAD superfamily hydrolase (TIGR01490 family)